MAKKIKKFEVKWTGKYPNLCSGEWIIKINGEVIKDKTEHSSYHQKEMPIYGSILASDMGTSGIYTSWHFDENWSEVFDDYEDGDDFSVWTKTEKAKRLFMLIEDNGFSLSKEDKRALFIKLQENDWRSGSCGGCI